MPPADSSPRRGAGTASREGEEWRCRPPPPRVCSGIGGEAALRTVGRAHETARRPETQSPGRRWCQPVRHLQIPFIGVGARRNRRNQQPTELASSPRRSAKKPLAPTSRHRAAAPTASAGQRRRPMDNFRQVQYVRLRSHVHGKYLGADRDGRSVSLRQRRASLKTAWGVHLIPGDDEHLLLYSAAYGRYLATTATPAPVAHRGYRVEQRDYDQPEVQPFRWKATASGFTHETVLLSDTNDRYLRANGKHTGKFLGWTTGVTVDDDVCVSTMMYWTVEPIPLRGSDMPQPGFAAPIPSRIAQELSVMLGRERGVWRLIRFVIANPEGVYAEDGNGWIQFHFGGRYLNSLRDEVRRRFNAPVRPGQTFAMCIRAGRYGCLTPLLKNLPQGGLGETVCIIVYLSETPAYDALRYPNVSGA